MRLIDADDFGNRMYHEAFEKDSDLQKWDSGCWIRYKLFENVLRGQPTVQPERKTGHWILLDECANSGYYCSECSKRVIREGWSKTVRSINYCPNCGAMMKGIQQHE